MFQVKFLIVNLLAFGLKGIGGKVFNCAALSSSPNTCRFDSQVLGINDTASFTVSSGLTPAILTWPNRHHSTTFRLHYSHIFQMLFTCTFIRARFEQQLTVIDRRECFPGTLQTTIPLSAKQQTDNSQLSNFCNFEFSILFANER